MKVAIGLGRWKLGGVCWSGVLFGGRTFEGVADALVVFKFLGAFVGSAHEKTWREIKGELPNTTNKLALSSEEVLLSNHDSNVLIGSHMIKKVSHSHRPTG